MILAADNIQTMNPKVADAIDRLDPRPIRTLAAEIASSGAAIVDINPGYLARTKQDRMVFLVETVQETVDLRLMLDSPQPEVLAKGLAACRRPPILNAVTCQPDKIEALPDMAARSGADLTALLLDPSGFPPQSHEEKLTLAQEIHQSAANHGLGLDRLIFDPVVPPMNWPDATLRAGEAIQTIRLLASGLFFQEPAATMIGLSNLLSGQRKTYPSTYDAALLAMAVGAGLSHALVNVLDPATRNTLKLIQQLGPKNGSTG